MSGSKRKPRKPADYTAAASALLVNRVQAEHGPKVATKAARAINKAVIARAVGQHDTFAGRGSGQSNARARNALKIRQMAAGTYVTPTVARERTVANAQAAWEFSSRMRFIQVCMRELRDDLTALDVEMCRLVYRAEDAHEVQEVATHLGHLQSAIKTLRRARRERMDAQAARIIEKAGARHAI